MSIQPPPSRPEPANIPIPLLEALARDYDLDPWQIRFLSCCPEGAEK